jgi:hypothetical protein
MPVGRLDPAPLLGGSTRPARALPTIVLSLRRNRLASIVDIAKGVIRGMRDCRASRDSQHRRRDVHLSANAVGCQWPSVSPRPRPGSGVTSPSEAATQVSCLLRMEGGSGRRDGGRRPTAGYGPSEPRDKLLELRHRRLTFAFKPLFDDVWARIAALRELDVIDTSLPIGHARTSPLIGTYVARAIFTTRGMRRQASGKVTGGTPKGATAAAPRRGACAPSRAGAEYRC